MSEADTGGVVMVVRPEPVHLLRRRLWSVPVLVAAVAGAMAVARTDSGSEYVASLVLVAIGVAVGLIDAYVTDRAAARSEIALLTHGRLRIRKGRRESVWHIEPGSQFYMGVAPSGDRVVIARGRGRRNRATIRGRLDVEDADELIAALKGMVPDLHPTRVVTVRHKGREGRRRSRETERVWEKVQEVLDDLVAAGFVRGLDVKVGVDSETGVIEVAVERNADALRAALAERLPMENVRVVDAASAP